MATINPYIHFNGNAEVAFNFYQSVFGGELTQIKRFKDLPEIKDFITDDEVNNISHIALPIGTSTLLGSDTPSFMGQQNEHENRSKIFIVTESLEEASTIFTKLSEGVSVEMPLSENPDGTHFAMFRDKYGIEWMIEYNPHK